MGNPKIIVYGSSCCGDCFRVRRILDQNQIAYQWINIDLDKKGEAYVRQVNKGMRSVPTIIFEDGSILVEPSTTVLLTKIGLMPNGGS